MLYPWGASLPMFSYFVSGSLLSFLIVIFTVYIVLHREREDQIQKLSEAQKQQAQHAEHALEDFKSQVERNSGRMFDEMKAQVDASIVVQLTSKELAKFEY